MRVAWDQDYGQGPQVKPLAPRPREGAWLLTAKVLLQILQICLGTDVMDWILCVM